MTADQQIHPEVQSPLQQPAAAAEAPPVAPPVQQETRTETERLDPQPVQTALKSGTQIDVEPLRLRQFLALLRILTRGAGSALSMGGLSSRDNDDFMRQLMAMLLFAIPEAEEETILFVKSMVRPQLPKGDPNFGVMKTLIDEELDNPELDDLVTVIELVVTNEAGDLRALGNRLRSMFETATKMGLTDTIN